MMKLIDKDKIGLTDFEIVMCQNDYKEALKLLIQKIEDLPVIDIVKCKDCRYGEIDDEAFPWQYFCGYTGDNWNDENHFCGYGERKDGS